MPTGISLQLHNGEAPLANLTGIQACWWNEVEPIDFEAPYCKAENLSTDSNGYLNLDLTSVCRLGDFGFLMLHQIDATDHKKSLIFQSKMEAVTITSGVDIYALSYTWDRPSDWLTLPTVGPTEEKFVGLLAVFDHDSNHVAVSAAGNFTVDWGDGSATENINGWSKAQHLYSYAALGAGTVCSRGYKQVIVTITPQGGQVLESIDLQMVHSAVGTDYNRNAPWLDIRVGSPNLIYAYIGSSNYPGDSTNYIHLTMLESFDLVSSALTDLSYMFQSCRALKVIKSLNTGQVTQMYSTFTGCSSLRHIPRISSGSAIACDSMFFQCYSLRKIPLFDISSSESTYEMFSGCSSLVEIPRLDTSSVTTMGDMFSNCYSLIRVPLIDTSQVMNMNAMFYGCSSLKEIPLFDTSSALAMQQMFSNAYSLKTIPSLDVSLVSNMSRMFEGASSLESVPPLDTPALTSVSYMFSNCYSLREAPSINLSLVTSLLGMFSTCRSLIKVPTLTTPLVTNFTNVFLACQSLEEVSFTDTSAGTSTGGLGLSLSSLSKLRMPGWKQTFSLADANLSAASLNQVYTDLATVTAKTITVTGNYGTSSDNPSIATAKGWTVTG